MENNEQEREVINVRIFNAPREVVFNAWADPALLSQWWGPTGFRNTFHQFEFKPGGNWNYTMHSPGGKDFANISIFETIQKPERIVFKHLMPVHVFWLTATFENIDGKTKLVFRQLFETAEECNRIKKFITEANEQNLDRLESVISKTLKK